MAFDPSAGDQGPQQPSNDFSKQLMAALATLAGGLGGRAIANSQGNPLTQAVPPQVSQLLDQSVARQAYQNPLFQATTQGAYAMLPDFAKTGTALSGTLSNAVQPPTNGSPSGGGMNPLAAGALGAGGGAALAALLGNAGKNGSSFDLGKIFDAIKKKFGGQIPGIQGNQPNAGGGLPSGNPGMNGFTGWDNSGGNNSDLPFLPSDPGFYVGGGQPTDPSGGSGVGPGMQSFYDWLNGGANGGGGDPQPPTGTNWWDE